MSIYTVSDMDWEYWKNTGRKPVERGKARLKEPKERIILHDIITESICTDGTRHCYLTKRSYKTNELQELSTRLDGRFWYSENHFVHSYGSRSETYISRSSWPEYKKTIEACRKLTGLEIVGWHPRAVARTADEWLRVRQKNIMEDRKLVKKILPEYHFTLVKPGIYRDMYLFDIRHAYWQMTRKAPSPLVNWDVRKRRLTWDVLDDNQRERWTNLLDTFEDHKSARLALFGGWTAGYSDYSSDRVRFYEKGKENYHNGYKPPALSTFALLVVRMVYELCQEECLLDDAVYGWTDSIMTHRDRPRYWQNMGLKFKRDAKGNLDLRRFDLYRIGSYTCGEIDIWGEPMEWVDENGIITTITPPPPRGVVPYLIPRDKYIHQHILEIWDKYAGT